MLHKIGSFLVCITIQFLLEFCLEPTIRILKSASNQKPKKDTLCMGVARAIAGKKRRPVLVSQ